MLRKRLAALVALIALGVAACSGGSVNTTPVPSSTPAGSTISGSGVAVAATGVTGITSSVTVAGSGSVTASESSAPATNIPVLSAIARKSAASLKTTQATTNTPLLYISLLATSPTTITGLPATSVTFATAPTGSVYLAYYNGTAWATIAGPATVSGTTVTFGATTFANPLTIATSASLFLAVYTGGVLVPATPTPGPTASPTATASAGASSSPSASPSPTHSPSASPSPSGSPTATPSPGASTTTVPVQAIVNGDFEGPTYTQSTYQVNNQASAVSAPNVLPTGWFICQNLSEIQPLPAAVATASFNVYVQVMNSTNQAAILQSGSGLNTTYFHGGSGAAIMGNPNANSPGAAGGTKGAWGICQDVVVPTGGVLTYWTLEAAGGSSATSTTGSFSGTPAPFSTGGGVQNAAFPPGSSQEGDILNPADSTQLSNLFPASLAGVTNTATLPAGNSVHSNTQIGTQTDWIMHTNDLSAQAGTTVRLYFGNYRSSAGTIAFSFLLLDDVQLNGTTVQSRSRLPGAFMRVR